MKTFMLAILVLSQSALAIPPQSGGQWVRKVERDSSSGDRSTFISVFSTNTIKIFGRSGRGKLTVGAYMTSPALLVDFFGKLPGDTFIEIETWCDDDTPEKGLPWVANKDNRAHASLPWASDQFKRMTTAKRFNIRFTAIDDEEHTL